MTNGSRRLRVPSPLAIRGLTLIAIGVAIELAVPIGLVIYPGESSSSGNSTGAGNVTLQPGCLLGTPAPLNPFCGLAAGLEILWNVVGIGVSVLGASWLIEWKRGKRGVQPGETKEAEQVAVPKPTGGIAGGYPPIVWVRCPQCGKPVEWPAGPCPRCSYEVSHGYR